MKRDNIVLRGEGRLQTAEKSSSASSSNLLKSKFRDAYPKNEVWGRRAQDLETPDFWQEWSKYLWFQTPYKASSTTSQWKHKKWLKKLTRTWSSLYKRQKGRGTERDVRAGRDRARKESVEDPNIPKWWTRKTAAKLGTECWQLSCCFHCDSQASVVFFLCFLGGSW